MAIVRDDHQRPVVVLQRFGERLAHLDVEVVGRLVEQQEVRPLPHDQREREARLFAAREAAHRVRHHVAAEIEAAEEVAQLLLAGGGVRLRQMPERRLRRAQLLDLVLREVTDRQRLCGVARAAARSELPRDRLQQRRLARAVGPEEPDPVAIENSPVEIGENGRALAVAERDVLEAHQLLRGDRHRGERELERAVDVRRRDPLHPFQRLDPALRLLGLRRLGAETVDEGLQVRDLPLLLRVTRLLQRELLRALALELRVIARVRPELQPVDMHDRRDDRVEEIAVVRDQQQRPGVAGEPVLEPQHGVQVEVIGRLVEEQQVRAAHQRLREIEAHPPAPGKTRDRIAVARRREAQAGEQRCRARARGVAADLLEAVVQQRERFAVSFGVAVGGALHRREIALDRAQLAVAVEHELDRGRRRRRGFLRDVGDRPRGRQLDVPGILVQFAEDQREQARLAAAVRADQADPVSGVDRQARAVEQALGAACQNEVADADHVGVGSMRMPLPRPAAQRSS